MAEKYLLPSVKLNFFEMVDGTAFFAPDFCKKHANTKCNIYYRTICNKEGIHTCPYGFNSFVKKINENNVIFSGLMIKDFFDGKKLKNKVNKDNLRILTKHNIERMTDFIVEYYEISKEKIINDNFIENTIHDMRKLNRIVKRSSKNIMDLNKSGKNYKYAKDINSASNIISFKLESYDISSNTNNICSNLSHNINIYNKFYKIKNLAENNSKGKKLIFIGKSSYEQSIYNEAFELLIYSLYENAIKHSTDGSSIRTEFISNDNGLIVMITNTCVAFDEPNLNNLFKLNYRINTYTKGSGIGLHNVKEICDKHGIDIKISTGEVFCNSTGLENIIKFNMILTFTGKAMIKNDDIYGIG